MSPRSERESFQPATVNTIDYSLERSDLEDLYSRLHIGDERSHTVREPGRNEVILRESFCVGKYDALPETEAPLAHYKRTLGMYKQDMHLSRFLIPTSEFTERRNSIDSTNSEATTIKCNSDSGMILVDKTDTAQPSSILHSGGVTRTISSLGTALAIREAPRISKPKTYSSKREKWRKLLTKVRNQIG